jgi:adenylosuccinate synthase
LQGDWCQTRKDQQKAMDLPENLNHFFKKWQEITHVFQSILSFDPKKIKTTRKHRHAAKVRIYTLMVPVPYPF